MRKIVNDTFMTIDGDISNMQDWHYGQQYNFELAGTEVHGNGLILLTTRR